MKVLIVDDELDVIDAIQLLVPWEELHINCVFSACDTSGAKKLLMEEKPEIVILDVVIGDDIGVDVARFITENLPQTRVISISGHSDFAYVHDMFIHGCVDYLLKPLEPHQLLSALKKAIDSITSESTQADEHNHRRLSELTEQQRQLMLVEMINGDNSNDVYSELCSCDARLRKSAECRILVCDLFFVSCYDSSLQEAFAVLRDFLEKHGYGILLTDEQRFQTCVILLFSNTEDALFQMQDILQSIYRKQKVYMAFGCSDVCKLPDGLAAAFDQARLSNMNINHSCFFSFYTESMKTERIHTNIRTENQMLSALLIGEKEQIKIAVHKWIKNIESNQDWNLGRIKAVWIYFFKLYQQWIEYFRDQYPRFRHKQAMYQSPPFSLPIEWNFIEQTLTGYFCKVMETIHYDIVSVRESNSTMNEVADYLYLNFAQPFDQRECSVLFHMNKEYMCRKFKETFGVGMVTYLTNIRIERSKELLISSDMKILDIAHAVGFSDERYFTKLFKKKTGQSPTAYRLKP